MTTQTSADPAVLADRRRIAAILALPEAKTAPQLAAKLAFEHGVSLETAKGVLAAAASPGVAGGDPHGWEAIVDDLNGRFGACASAADAPAASPTTRSDPHEWDAVVAAANARLGL